MANVMFRNMSVIGAMLVCVVWSGSAFANPPGSYDQTCRNVQSSGENLSAECQRTDGRWNKTSLAFADTCVGIISNVDGNLACLGPVGSFTRTCRNIRLEGSTIYANCQRTDGSWVDAESSFSGFQSPVRNCDGKLINSPTCQ